MDKAAPPTSSLESFPKHVHAIGMISIELANLEILLGRMLAALLRIPPGLGEILYLTPRTGMGRIEVLENIAREVLVAESKGLRQVTKIIGRVKAVMNDRHGMIHVVWTTSLTDPKRVGKIKVPILNDAPQVQPVSIERLTGLVKRIRNLHKDVASATAHMRRSGQPSASPAKSS
jgi:hypothetical protein